MLAPWQPLLEWWFGWGTSPQAVADEKSTQHYQFKKGQGCGQCHGSGYKGRKGMRKLLRYIKARFA